MAKILATLLASLTVCTLYCAQAQAYSDRDGYPGFGGQYFSNMPLYRAYGNYGSPFNNGYGRHRCRHHRHHSWW